MKEFEKYKRNAVFSLLKEFDISAKEHAYIEVTEWNNREGFDINVYNYTDINVSISYGEYNLLKKLIKKLDK